MSPMNAGGRRESGNPGQFAARQIDAGQIHFLGLASRIAGQGVGRHVVDLAVKDGRRALVEGDQSHRRLLPDLHAVDLRAGNLALDDERHV